MSRGEGTDRKARRPEPQKTETIWRWLVTERLPARQNMAIDEAVLEAVAEGAVPPTLRLYSWTPPAVSIGYFQTLDAVVDRVACEREGVDIVRRMTGGGAVLHDAEITYSVIVPVGAERIPPRVVDCYRTICGALIDTLQRLGPSARFKAPNDILIDGRKISGSAMTERRHTILQHGTLLLDLDIEKMFTLLRVPAEKRAAVVEAVKQTLTALSEHMETVPPFDELAMLLAEHFARRLRIELKCGELTDEERVRAKALAVEKYGHSRWTSKQR